MMFAAVRFFDGAGKVQHGQEREHARLDEGHEHTEAQDHEHSTKGDSARSATSSLCFASMLPKRRNARETGRARWLMTSKGIISGARSTMGPTKCLKYEKPCLDTPMIWVAKNTVMARAAVVLMFPVGDSKPGTSPCRLDTRMKRKRLPMSGKYRFPSGP